MPESTTPKLFAFVLMPFSSEFRDIYELGIKQACIDENAYCERVDEQIFDDSILQRVYNQIDKADLIIADMTGRNPNVFYEVGYAHALGKRVILLTQSADDIPFDLKHFPHIIYGGQITVLKDELRKRVAWCVANPQKPLTIADIAVEVLANGLLLEDSPSIVCKDIGDQYYAARIELQIHNQGSTTLNEGLCALGFVVPTSLIQMRQIDLKKNSGGIESYPAGAIDTEFSMIDLPLSRPLLPDARHTFVLALGMHEEWYVDAKVRLFTELGTKEYSLNIECIR